MADSLIYESTRKFVVCLWPTTHGGLLLRTVGDHDELVPIEVWFKPADFVCIPEVLEGLSIWVTDREPEPLVRPIEPWQWTYRVVTPEIDGWVVGGSVSGREVEEPEDPRESRLYDWSRREGTRRLFQHQPGTRK